MQPIVTTRQGSVRGVLTGAVAAFKGIPYAAAPFGALRFAAPAPAPEWDDVHDCSDYGPTAPKPPIPDGFERFFPEPTIPGRDVLNLNIWTPDPSVALPVLFWIHGGSFAYGTGAVSLYDGAAFARDGVVCVTINYRLGVDGFLLLDGAPANRGLLDQIAALRWVRENIDAFGGDPDNVTIAGESAGAMSVCHLLAMPQAKGLFRRAIAQSGAAQNLMSRDTAQRVTALVAETLGVAATVGELAAVPIEELIATQGRLAMQFMTNPDPVRWPELARDLLIFEPCLDGEVIDTPTPDALAAGASAGVDVLIGTNDDEFTVFFVPLGVPATITDDMLHAFLGGHGADVDAAVAAYRAERPGGTSGQLWLDAFRDTYYRIPAIRVAEARAHAGDPTHVNEFGWRSPQLDGVLGACHYLDIGFVFDNLTDPSTHALSRGAAPQALADEMHRAWVSFVRTGDPGWPPYGANRTVMRFGSDGIVDDPAAGLRTTWNALSPHIG